MVKGTLRFENTAFDEEGKFGSVIIAKPDGNGGTDVVSATLGEGNAIEIAYMLGETMGKIINELAGENPVKRAVVWDVFIKSLMRNKKGEE